MKRLPDTLLIEILSRLPIQWAVQCKSVSKHWNSLISSPYFARRFLLHHSQSETDESITIVLEMASDKQLALIPTPYIYCRGAFVNLLKFLPFPKHHLHIYASSNDLLLAARNDDSSLDFFICNPLTKQWLPIPRIPKKNYDQLGRERVVLHALIICQQEGSIENYRYKVVRIHCPYKTTTTQLQMEIFSSETGEWCNVFVESPRELNPFNSMSKDSGVFPCNGMLYLVDTNKDFIRGFLVYDPFNDIGHLRYIDLPVEQDFSPKDPIFFGVFRGHLRIIQRTHDRDHPAFSGNGKFDPRRYCFSVWELEDYANAADAAAAVGDTWSFKYKVYFTDIVPERPSLNEILNGIRSDVNFLAFHPNDAELVLLKFGSYIVSCNMHTGDLNMAGQIPDGMDDFSNVRPPIFLLGQPLWPTPLPPRPLESE